MSGVEILAIAASVLQIADLGARLSVKLFTYSRKIKNADKHIDSISTDIAGTGAVLQLLGKELEKDESLRLCSDEAIAQARRLMVDCHKIFEDLNDAIDGNSKAGSSGSKLIFGLKQRLKYPFLEPQIDLLKAKLEKLKADLMVMLNVLIYGGQLRSHEALPVLRDQQDLLKSLIEERMQSQKQLDLVMKRLDQLVVSESSSASTFSRETFATTSSDSTLINSGSSVQGPPLTPTPDYHPPSLPMCLHDRAGEIFDHCRLVNAMIDEVNHAQYKLHAGIRYRAQEKILESHYDEWSNEWQHHAGVAEHRYDYFEKHHHLKTYWKGRDNEKTPTNITIAASDADAVLRGVITERELKKIKAAERLFEQATKSPKKKNRIQRNPTRSPSDSVQRENPPKQTASDTEQMARREASMAQQQDMLQKQLMQWQQWHQHQQQQQQIAAQQPAVISGQTPPMMQMQQAQPNPILKAPYPTNTRRAPKLSLGLPDDYFPGAVTSSRPRKQVAKKRALSGSENPARTTSTSPLLPSGQTATSMPQDNIPSAADTTPSTTETPQDTSDAGPQVEESFNLDFSTLENTDVLENFDFDNFLNKSTEDAPTVPRSSDHEDHNMHSPSSASTLSAERGKQIGPPPISHTRRSSGTMPGILKRAISSPQIEFLGHGPERSTSTEADKKRSKLGSHRTAVACGHCRRRKLRCIPAYEDTTGTCQNCIRLKKACHFFPVDWQTPDPKEPHGVSSSDQARSAHSRTESPDADEVDPDVPGKDRKRLRRASSQSHEQVAPEMESSSHSESEDAYGGRRSTLNKKQKTRILGPSTKHTPSYATVSASARQTAAASHTNESNEMAEQALKALSFASTKQSSSPPGDAVGQTELRYPSPGIKQEDLELPASKEPKPRIGQSGYTKRRATMNCRTAYDEDEILRRTIEDSKSEEDLIDYSDEELQLDMAEAASDPKPDAGFESEHDVTTPQPFERERKPYIAQPALGETYNLVGRMAGIVEHPDAGQAMASGSNDDDDAVQSHRHMPGLKTSRAMSKRKVLYDDLLVPEAKFLAAEYAELTRAASIDQLRALVQMYTSIPKVEIDRSLAMVDSLSGYN